jgi:hypothetical protein
MASIPSSDEEVEMYSAASHVESPAAPTSRTIPLDTYINQPEGDNISRIPTPVTVNDVDIEEKVATEPSLDLLDRIPGMFRLLDLVAEQGSNGIGQFVSIMTPNSKGSAVDKILIAQDSVARFANLIHPGSHQSEIQVGYILNC